MGLEALTHQDDGTKIDVPVTEEDWQQWISAGRTRNWMLQDPLIDWLHLYGNDRGYIPKADLSSYRQNLDFVAFLFERARAFELGILDLLKGRFDVVTVAENHADIRHIEKAKQTFRHMQDGVPIIYQGVLWNAQHRTYGSPDFLIRSDMLSELFPASFPASMATIPAPDLGNVNWHYCVIDTKFTTLHLNAAGTELANGGSALAYKAQLFIYNRMLGRLQGYTPPQSFLLGRGWEFESKGVTHRGRSALDRIAPVNQNGTITGNVLLADEVGQALEWIRRVRTDGHKWDVLPAPTVPELYPNAGADDDEFVLDVAEFDGDPDEEHPHRWVSAKKLIASQLKELTQLWQVGPSKRNEAHSVGVYQWDDPKLTPAIVGVTGTKRAPTLEAIIAVNTTVGGPFVRRAALKDTSAEWRDPMQLEFYVDFEYCNDLNDDFTKLPERGGQPLIFMIGCGHLEKDTWLFRSFVVSELTELEELRIIQDWTTHMADVQKRLGVVSEDPRVFHWSHAEVTVLEKAYNSARERHGANATWPTTNNWYDFLTKVMREEPIVVQGALGFGLKAIANAMHAHGLIDTNWADSPVDGLGAMVGAWRCDEERQSTGVSLDEMPLMQEIARYNEIDCKAMMEIVSYLRAHH